MKQGLKLLVLAGSAEARQIASAARLGGMAVRALVSEPPRGPNPMPVPCDLHGFDDLAGVMSQMQDCDAVLDASHGFDGRMSRLGHAAAAELGLPFLSYARPVWQVDAARDMHAATDVAEAMMQAGSRVFSATGWASLPEYAGFKGEVVFLRQTTPHDRPAPYKFVQLVFGDPPFSQEDEVATFERLHIDTLICRNLGGRASYPKVAAALELGIKVILIGRPSLPPEATCVTDVEAAVAWLETL